MDNIILKLRSQTKEIQEHQNDLSGIGQAWNEIIAPMGFDKIEHRQIQHPSAIDVTKKLWDNNKK